MTVLLVGWETMVGAAGLASTESVASELVMVPFLLVMITLNFEPLSARVAVRFSVADVSPAREGLHK